MSQFEPILAVHRMIVESQDANVKARPGVLRLYLGLVAKDMANVLTQEALDTLAHLLRAIDVPLMRAPALAAHERTRLSDERHPCTRTIRSRRDTRCPCARRDARCAIAFK